MYLHSSGRVEWASQLFANQVFAGAGNGDFVIRSREDAPPKPLPEWLHSLTGCRTLSLATPPHGLLELKAWVTHLPVAGASVWWDILVLYTQLRFSAERQLGRWAAHSWDRWLNFLQTGAGLGRHLVSKALQQNSDKGHDRLGLTIMDSEGAGDFRMVSTHGLLALLSRRAFASQCNGGMERADDKQSASLCLDALLGRAMPGDFTLFLSGQSFSEQGWPTASRPVVLHGVKGGLRLFPLTKVRHRLCLDICEHFHQGSCGEEVVTRRWSSASLTC